MLLIARCSDEIFLEMAEAQMCCRDIWTFCCLMKSIDCWILPEPRYTYDSKERKMTMRVDIFSKVGKCGWTERLSDRSLRCLSSPSAKNQDAISTIHPDYSNTWIRYHRHQSILCTETACWGCGQTSTLQRNHEIKLLWILKLLNHE
jgi:hypothetical protein